MKLRVLFLPLLLAISFSFANPCEPGKNLKKKEVLKPPPDATVYPVSVVYPRFIESARTVSGSGKFSVSDRLIVRTSFSGEVEKTYVGEGDMAAQGDPLALFSDDTLTQEIDRKEAELKEAEAALENDKKNFGLHGGAEPSSPEKIEEETEPVFLDEDPLKKETTPKVFEPKPDPNGSESIDWEAKLKVSEAKVEKLNTELDQLEERLKTLTLNAPLAGMIQKRHVTEGSIFIEEDPLFEIVAINPMSLSFHVPHDVASYVDKQSGVLVTPLATPEVTLNGAIFYISPGLDSVNKSLELRAHVPNENGLIKEGQEGRAVVKTRKIEKILVVPRKALVTQEGRNGVYVVYIVQGNKVYQTDVEPGQNMGEFDVEILANIRLDDPIVITGQEKLSNGSFIKIAEEIPALSPIHEELPPP